MARGFLSDFDYAAYMMKLFKSSGEDLEDSEGLTTDEGSQGKSSGRQSSDQVQDPEDEIQLRMRTMSIHNF